MARFLLVHGSGHGAWCWRDLAPQLEALGHTVETLDLPGMGADETPLEEVTLAGYGAAIQARLTEPTVLVGHSAGGYAITEAAEADPTNVARLVYLCAYLPRSDATLVEMRRESAEQPLADALEVDTSRRAFRFRDHALAENLYGDCPPGTLDYARPRLSWQPIAPQSTAITTTGKSTALPKSYIVCENDHTIPPELQRRMSATLPAEDVYAMATGHSPFFADPDGLATLLDKIVRD